MSTARVRSPCPKTAVIIPYYQEKPGILRKAVLSAISQEVMGDLEIIVVDDGSPAPAREEARNLNLPAHVTLKLIEQANRGPGAARNTGLDNVSPETFWVAFLDSDDEWLQHHLQSAQQALQSGADMYFSNAWSQKKSLDIFAICGAKLEWHVCIDAKRGLYRMLDCGPVFVRENFAHVSTLVYDYRKIRRSRFPEAFRIGEDRAFLFNLAADCDMILFSTDAECLIRRQGVNIYQGVEWDSPRTMWLLSERFKCLKWIIDRADGCPEIYDFVTDSIAYNREQFVLSLLHNARRARIGSISYALEFLQTDPQALRHLLPIAYQTVARKLGARS